MGVRRGVIGGLWAIAAMACTPRPASIAAKDVPVPVLSAETKAAWAAFEAQLCGPQEPEGKEAKPECEPARAQAAIESCSNASICIAALRTWSRCTGAGHGPLAQDDPRTATLERMAVEHCDEVVEVLTQAHPWAEPWWAVAPRAEAGLACVSQSEHPDARRLLLFGGGERARAWLLREPKKTAAWMAGFLRRVPASRPGFTQALEFWELFDALPQAQQRGLVPAVGVVSTMVSKDAWVTAGWRGEAIDRLGALGGPEVVAPLQTVLTDERYWTLQHRAADALASLGPRAAAARGDLEAIAEGHWSALVRAKANRAIRAIDGGDVRAIDERAHAEPLDPRNPEVLLPVLGSHRTVWSRRFEPWSVMLDGHRRIFENQPSETPKLPPELASLDLEAQFPDHEGIHMWQFGLSLVLPAEGGWILGMDNGEFGGGAWFVNRDGQARLLAPGNVLGHVELGGTRYVLQGLAHLGFSNGALLRIVTEGEHVDLELATELPEAPTAVAVVEGRLLQATPRGVYVISSDLTIEKLPFATEHDAPRELPEAYPAAVEATLKQHHEALQRCMKPLSGLLTSCDASLKRTSVWFDVDAKGSVAQVLSRDENPYTAPPAPEVTACIGQVAAEWTFPAFEDGWTSFGVTLAVE